VFKDYRTKCLSHPSSFSHFFFGFIGYQLRWILQNGPWIRYAKTRIPHKQLDIPDRRPRFLFYSRCSFTMHFEFDIALYCQNHHSSTISSEPCQSQRADEILKVKCCVATNGQDHSCFQQLAAATRPVSRHRF